MARQPKDLGVDAVTHLADVGDEESLRHALDAVTEDQGLPDVVVYNAAAIRRNAPGELDAEEHLRLWRVNVLGAYTAAAHLAPEMAQRGHGTFLTTGGMPEPQAAYTSLSLGKAGLRTVTALFAEQSPRCTSPRSPSAAPWRRAPRSTRTSSPSITGGCTPSASGSGKC
ncbi:SDR family oxidoreductase [Amycolatopsis sp. NPDC051372]|uniref:SDR family oxidoreductase n=1 Tax=unclassified Amycolatopsis TaxID=2618356 RepID=UPI003426E95D